MDVNVSTLESDRGAGSAELAGEGSSKPEISRLLRGRKELT